MTGLRTRALDERTWPDFAALVERHDGVWGGCWCMAFHAAYLEGAAEPPDWRITCFFVDRRHRGEGVASAALAGALAEIARLGGGTVESYPEAVEGRPVSASFLHNATVALFARHGFERTRPLGKHHWVVTRVVSGVPAGGP
jgi:GNAT superfamily N-acetyltransferase